MLWCVLLAAYLRPNVGYPESSIFVQVIVLYVGMERMEDDKITDASEELCFYGDLAYRILSPEVTFCRKLVRRRRRSPCYSGSRDGVMAGLTFMEEERS